MALPGGAMLACMLFATFFIVFCGEVLPKVYVQKRRLSITRRAAALLDRLEKPLSPLARLLMGISSYIEKHYMLKAYNHTIQDLHHSLDVALTNEETSPEERRILRGVVNFGSITVKQIMRPRVDVMAFSTQMTLPELLPLIVQWGYSRIP